MKHLRGGLAPTCQLSGSYEYSAWTNVNRLSKDQVEIGCRKHIWFPSLLNTLHRSLYSKSKPSTTFSWIFHNISPLCLQFLRVFERQSSRSQSSTLRWRESQSVRRSQAPVTNWPRAALCLWQRFSCCSFPAFTDMTSWNPSRAHSGNISTNIFIDDVQFLICLNLSLILSSSFLFGISNSSTFF